MRILASLSAKDEADEVREAWLYWHPLCNKLIISCLLENMQE